MTELKALTVAVVTKDSQHLIKAVEVLSRAAAGLTLDGITVTITMGVPELAEEDAADTTN
jgi:hypothetical protein